MNSDSDDERGSRAEQVGGRVLWSGLSQSSSSSSSAVAVTLRTVPATQPPKQSAAGPANVPALPAPVQPLTPILEDRYEGLDKDTVPIKPAAHISRNKYTNENLGSLYPFSYSLISPPNYSPCFPCPCESETSRSIDISSAQALFYTVPVAKPKRAVEILGHPSIVKSFRKLQEPTRLNAAKSKQQYSTNSSPRVRCSSKRLSVSNSDATTAVSFSSTSTSLQTSVHSSRLNNNNSNYNSSRSESRSESRHTSVSEFSTAQHHQLSIQSPRMPLRVRMRRDEYYYTETSTKATQTDETELVEKGRAASSNSAVRTTSGRRYIKVETVDRSTSPIGQSSPSGHYLQKLEDLEKITGHFVIQRFFTRSERDFTAWLEQQLVSKSEPGKSSPSIREDVEPDVETDAVVPFKYLGQTGERTKRDLIAESSESTLQEAGGGDAVVSEEVDTTPRIADGEGSSNLSRIDEVISEIEEQVIHAEGGGGVENGLNGSRPPSAARSDNGKNGLNNVSRPPSAMKSDDGKNGLNNVSRPPSAVKSDDGKNGLNNVSRPPSAVKSDDGKNGLINMSRPPSTVKSEEVENALNVSRPTSGVKNDEVPTDGPCAGDSTGESKEPIGEDGAVTGSGTNESKMESDTNAEISANEQAELETEICVGHVIVSEISSVSSEAPITIDPHLAVNDLPKELVEIQSSPDAQNELATGLSAGGDSKAESTAATNGDGEIQPDAAIEGNGEKQSESVTDLTVELGPESQVRDDNSELQGEDESAEVKTEVNSVSDAKPMSDADQIQTPCSGEVQAELCTESAAGQQEQDAAQDEVEPVADAKPEPEAEKSQSESDEKFEVKAHMIRQEVTVILERPPTGSDDDKPEQKCLLTDFIPCECFAKHFFHEESIAKLLISLSPRTSTPITPTTEPPVKIGVDSVESFEKFEAVLHESNKSKSERTTAPAHRTIKHSESFAFGSFAPVEATVMTAESHCQEFPPFVFPHPGVHRIRKSTSIDSCLGSESVKTNDSTSGRQQGAGEKTGENLNLSQDSHSQTFEDLKASIDEEVLSKDSAMDGALSGRSVNWYTSAELVVSSQSVGQHGSGPPPVRTESKIKEIFSAESDTESEIIISENYHARSEAESDTEATTDGDAVADNLGGNRSDSRRRVDDDNTDVEDDDGKDNDMMTRMEIDELHLEMDKPLGMSIRNTCTQTNRSLFSSAWSDATTSSTTTNGSESCIDLEVISKKFCSVPSAEGNRRHYLPSSSSNLNVVNCSMNFSVKADESKLKMSVSLPGIRVRPTVKAAPALKKYQLGKNTSQEERDLPSLWAHVRNRLDSKVSVDMPTAENLTVHGDGVAGASKHIHKDTSLGRVKEKERKSERPQHHPQHKHFLRAYNNDDRIKRSLERLSKLLDIEK